MKLSFKSKLEANDMMAIGMSHTFLVPEEVSGPLMVEMKKVGSKRMWVVVNGSRSNRALHKGSDGEYYIGVGKPWIKEAGLLVGATYVLDIDTEGAEEIVMPMELVEVLDLMPEAKEAWEQATPGKQRGIVAQVNMVKSSDAKIRRSLAMIDMLMGVKRER